MDHFQNARLSPEGFCQGDPAPEFISKYFDKSVQRIDDFLQSARKDEDETSQALQKALLAPLVNESVVGQYSIM